jgi:hypothetical protein
MMLDNPTYADYDEGLDMPYPGLDEDFIQAVVDVAATLPGPQWGPDHGLASKAKRLALHLRLVSSS